MMINYFHDLSVAILASNIFAVWFVGKYAQTHQIDKEFMENLFAKLSKVTWIAFALVIAGGAFRGWFFMEYEWNPAVGKGQVAALVVKHIVLVAVTLFGLITHFKYQKIYGKKQ